MYMNNRGKGAAPVAASGQIVASPHVQVRMCHVTCHMWDSYFIYDMENITLDIWHRHTEFWERFPCVVCINVQINGQNYSVTTTSNKKTYENRAGNYLYIMKYVDTLLHTINLGSVVWKWDMRQNQKNPCSI